MKVVANLTQGDLKAAVAEYLKNNGFNTVPENVHFNMTRGDRPGEVDTFTASAECDSTPVKPNKPVYRGDELDMPRRKDKSFGVV